MTSYIIQAFSGEFLDKNLAWVKEAKPDALFQAPHKDVALNQLLELNAKDVNLRARVVDVANEGSGDTELAANGA